RFMMNAWKFQFERSPAGLLKLLSKAERAKVAAGDPTTLTRAAIGGGLFYAAWEIRNDPDLAGEKWYDVKDSNGVRHDARPFAPFATYLLAAEVVRRLEQGDSMVELRDFAEGVAASQFRAGAGKYMLEEVQKFTSGFLEAATKSDTFEEGLEKATRSTRRFGGEILGGFAQPLTTFRELYADYGEFLPGEAGRLAQDESKIRTVSEDPFTGPFKRRIPIVSQSLPEREKPLSGASQRIELAEVGGIPLSRQLVGLSGRVLNQVEKESERLGIQFQEISPRTGDPRINRLILREMGPLVEKRMPRLLQSAKFKKASNEKRRLLFTQNLAALRKAATAKAFKNSRGEDRKTFIRKRILQGINQRTREFLESVGRAT
ncbi:hypothetical protein LCGC14_2559340, partial [marine sediment metagenome]